MNFLNYVSKIKIKKKNKYHFLYMTFMSHLILINLETNVV